MGMQFRNFGKTGKKLSVLGFGAMRLPLIDKEDPSSIDFKKSIQMIRYAIEHGVNYIDTAYPYHNGMSEIFISKVFENGYRQRANIADKLPCWKIDTYEDCDKFFNEQLQRLGVKEIDFYLLHALNKKSWNKVYNLGVLDWLEIQKKSGKIKFYGFSFHDEYPVYDLILNSFHWDFCQLQLNYLDTEYQQGIKGYLDAVKKGIGVIVMEPLKGGRLAKPKSPIKEMFEAEGKPRTPVQWALDWVWDLPEVSMLLSGMSSLQQVKQNIEYAQIAKPNNMTKSEKDFIQKIEKSFNDLILVNCTDCKYCMPCPFGINIPLNFEMLNNTRFASVSLLKKQYLKVLTEEQRAKQCKQCGVCEEKCPQKIKIMTELVLVSKTFK